MTLAAVEKRPSRRGGARGKEAGHCRGGREQKTCELWGIILIVSFVIRKKRVWTETLVTRDAESRGQQV